MSSYWAGSIAETCLDLRACREGETREIFGNDLKEKKKNLFTEKSVPK